MRLVSSFRNHFPVALLLAMFVSAAPALAQPQTVMYNGRPAVASEILVRLRNGDGPALTRVRRAVTNGEMHEVSRALSLHLVRSGSNNIAGLLQALANHPDVLYAEPNYIVQAVSTQPSDPSFPALWGMQRIGAPDAWDVARGRTSPVIAIIDTGVDYTHPDLAANIWSAPAAFSLTIQGRIVNCPAGSHGFNAITFTCDPWDDHSHGSHVAGTIGATGNNSFGVTGVNWQARMMALKFLGANGSGSVSNAIAAIEFAIQVKAQFAGTSTPVDVRVLSNSWGSGGASQSLLDEINKAGANEMLFVAAAGNNSANDDNIGFYPAAFSRLAANVIAVAATDYGDGLAGFSNYGAQTVQLAAPGVDIYSTVPGGSYASYSGTSMATPHVAGAALLTAGQCPALNTAALKAAILDNVDRVPGLAAGTSTGGRLNVNRAVRSCTVTSSLKAVFLGATGEDYTGFSNPLTGNGIPDWHIQLTNLRGSPTRVRIVSGRGGFWTSPFDGVSWYIYSRNGLNSVDLWIEPWASPDFHLTVFYSDGTIEEADATTAPVSAPSQFSAQFLGTPGQDYVGPVNQEASGQADWNIHLQGMRGTPSRVQISSAAGGLWEGPFNGANWIVLTQADRAGNADLWFEPSLSSNFHVKVWYSDGTSEESDATNAPALPTSLSASFLGITGEDFVGPGNQTTGNGVADWHVRLQGLRSTPAKIRIESPAGGAWESPFNGLNWILYLRIATSDTADFWFEPWGTTGFHVKVWYVDGSIDEADLN